MPPRHASKPSTGLAGDLDQLSPLSESRPTPGHTGIQIDEAELASAPSTIRGLDPRFSGQFERVRGCCGRTFHGILNFPSLALIFPLTVVVSLFLTFLCLVAAPDAFAYLANPDASSFLPSSGGLTIAIIFTALLTILAMLASRQLLYQLFQGEIKPLQIVGLYLATIILYADMYLCCLLLDPTSFVFQQAPDLTATSATTNVASVWVGLIYFSVTTVTCTGFGDIAPRYWFVKLIAGSELLLSIIYHIGIFSVGLDHFQSQAQLVAEGKIDLQAHDGLMAAAQSRMRSLRTKYPRLDALRKLFIRFSFYISLLIQLVFLLILHISSPDMFNQTEHSAHALLILIFFIAQCCQLLLIILMTFALIRQINKSHVQPAFLLQSWMSTVTLFCGIYTLIYLLVPGYQSFVLWDTTMQVQQTHAVADVVGQFMWFSISVMTTAGYGDVFPVHVAARLAVCVQMLIGVCYTVVILGQALVSTIGYINQVRMEKGAQPLQKPSSPVGPPPRGSTASSSRARSAAAAPAAIEEELQYEEESVAAQSLSGFEGPGGAMMEGEEEESYTTASEVEEEEEQYAPPPPPQRQQQRTPMTSAAAKRAAATPQPTSAAAAAPAGRAPPASAPQKARAAAAAAAAATAAAALGAADAAHPEWRSDLSAADAALTAQTNQLARAGAAQARTGLASAKRALPGLQAQAQRGLASAGSAAGAGARQASAALEARAPGLQKQMAADARALHYQAQEAAAMGSLVGGLVAEHAMDTAMADPRVRGAVNAAKPQVAQARQSLGAAAAKAKAAAAQAAEHARVQSAGMFDPPLDEDDPFGV